ncbi:hypothetical protein CAC42_5900 [Sphaceloma murrayae]|uniref:SAP domain-containing protein n=1 Tax=Sphaceloma murrayae TaxID=2082308 RepID=A0A2K1QZL9_9PEZI|nr:hypothetical protein CAC42_5900 [Sphaceloma murrayae]
MADYSKMKNAELEALLKERGLAHTGKKAELVKRLQDADAAATTTDAPKKDEDEIDWDDEPTTAAGTTTAEPAAAVVQTEEAGSADTVAENDTATVSASADAAAEPEKPVEETKPAKDFTAGIATSTIDEEIAKRKARAKKFNMDESADETLKALERAKKFGASELSDKLNQALPERRERKRGHEGEDAGDRKRGRPGMRGGRRGSGRPNTEGRPQPRTNNGGGNWMNEADRAKAEARKAKFATAS